MRSRNRAGVWIFCLLEHILCNSAHNVRFVSLRSNYTKNGGPGFALFLNEYSLFVVCFPGVTAHCGCIFTAR
jgi:hypothetical protein